MLPLKSLSLRYVLIGLAVTSAALFLGRYNHPPRDFERARLMMGTVFEVKVHDATGKLSKKRFFKISEILINRC